MNRAFKVIQGHLYWCRQESRTVYCRNVQLMLTLFSETYEDTPTGKRQIRRFQRLHAGLKTSQQETPSNIYNDLYCQKLELLTYIFVVIILQSRTL